MKSMMLKRAFFIKTRSIRPGWTGEAGVSVFIGYIKACHNGECPSNIPKDAHTKSTRGYETIEEMIEQYILHDGTRLKDAVEMDCTDWGRDYKGEMTVPMPEWPDKLVEKKKE